MLYISGRFGYASLAQDYSFDNISHLRDGVRLSW